MGRGKKAKGKSAPAKRKGKARSGNPAKRALEEQGLAPRGGEGATGLPAGLDLPADFELPEELKGLLPPGAGR